MFDEKFETASSIVSLSDFLEEAAAPKKTRAPKVNIDKDLNTNFLQVLETVAGGLAALMSAFTFKSSNDAVASLTLPRTGDRLDGNYDQNIRMFVMKKVLSRAVATPTAFIQGLAIKNDKIGFTLNPFGGVGGHLLVEYRPKVTKAMVTSDMGEEAKDLPTNAEVFKEFAKSLLPLFQKGIQETGTARATVPLASLLKTSSSKITKEESADPRMAEGTPINDDVKSLLKAVKIDFDVTMADKSELPSGSLAELEFELQVKINIEVPMSFAMLATNTEDPEDFGKAYFYLYIERAVDMLFNKMFNENLRSGKQRSRPVIWPPVISNASKLVQTISTFHADFPNAGRPRTNDRGWSVMRDGSLRRFQTYEKGTRMTEMLRDLERQIDVNLKGGEDARDLKEIMKGPTYAGRTLVTDWGLNDVLVSMTKEGEIKTEKMTGVRGLSKSDENWLLERPLIDAEGKPISGSPLFSAMPNITNFMANKFRSDVDDYRRTIDYNNNNYYQLVNTKEIELREKYPDMERALRDLLRALRDSRTPPGSPNNPHELRLKHLCGLDLDVFEGHAQKENILAAIATIKRGLSTAYENESEALPDTMADDNRQGPAAWMLETAATMTPDRHAALKKTVAEEAAKGVQRGLPKGFKVPNLKPETAVMPHQADTIGVANSDPMNMIMAVGTGGGKTITQIITALLYIKEHPGAKVLILTLKRLIPQFLDDIASFSGGDVNGVPLVVGTQDEPGPIERMLELDPTNTMKKLVQWVRDLPPNSIFLGAHDDMKNTRVLFKEMPTSVGYLSHHSDVSHFAIFIKACGFNKVLIDEAHEAFNVESTAADRVTRSEGVQRALQGPETRGLGSGTIINNQVVHDTWAAMYLMSPLRAGTYAAFCKKYGFKQGAMPSGDQLKAVLKDLNDVSAFVSKSAEDWAFVLPKMTTKFYDVVMTKRQSEFYELSLRAKIEKIFKKKTDSDENEEVTVTLSSQLQGLEQWMVAPDDPMDGKNKFPSLVPPPSPEDLISPMVGGMERVIRQHIVSKDEGKVLVFSINKVGSAHYMKHLPSMLSDILPDGAIIRYTTGDAAAIKAFQDDKNVRVMLCDETSLSAGYNLQQASLIIRTQCRWTPGSDEQSRARMYRPDLKSDTLRENVRQAWLIMMTSDGRNTIDAVKASRLFSKKLASCELGYAQTGNMALNRRARLWSDKLENSGIKVENVKQLKITPDTLLAFQTKTREEYFQVYDLISSFENLLAEQTRQEVANQIKAETGVEVMKNGVITDVKSYLGTIMTDVYTTERLPGSKAVYVPSMPNASFADPHGIDMENGSDLAASDFKAGSFVMTEYGPAKVVANPTRSRSLIAVQTAIDKEPKLLPPNRVARAKDAKGLAKLAAMYAEPTRHALIPPGAKLIRGDTLLPVKKVPGAGKPVVKEKPSKGAEPEEVTIPTGKPKKVVNKLRAHVEEGQDQDEAGGEDFDFHVHPVALNGMPALMIPGDPPKELADKHVWHKINTYIAYQATSIPQMKKFLKRLNDLGKIPPTRLAELEAELARVVQTRKANTDKMPTTTVVNAFLRDLTRPKKAIGGTVLVPVLLEINKKVVLVFPKLIHTAAALTLVRQAAATSQGAVSLDHAEEGGNFSVAFFRSTAELEKEIHDLNAMKDVSFNKKEMQAVFTEASKLLKGMRALAKVPNPKETPAAAKKRLAEEAETLKADKEARADPDNDTLLQLGKDAVAVKPTTKKAKDKADKKPAAKKSTKKPAAKKTSARIAKKGAGKKTATDAKGSKTKKAKATVSGKSAPAKKPLTAKKKAELKAKEARAKSRVIVRNPQTKGASKTVLTRATPAKKKAKK